jgi:hypothetical protein
VYNAVLNAVAAGYGLVMPVASEEGGGLSSLSDVSSSSLPHSPSFSLSPPLYSPYSAHSPITNTAAKTRLALSPGAVMLRVVESSRQTSRGPHRSQSLSLCITVLRLSLPRGSSTTFSLEPTWFRSRI